MTHTPAPWEVVSEFIGPYMIKAKADNNHTVALVADVDNARLIAAAPDLLEALEAAIECGMVPKTSAKEGGASKYARQAHVADMIRAAIAKARGQSAEQSPQTDPEGHWETEG